MQEINSHTETRNYDFKCAQHILSIYNLFAQARRHKSHLVKLLADLSSLVFTMKVLNSKSQPSFNELRISALKLLCTMIEFAKKPQDLKEGAD